MKIIGVVGPVGAGKTSLLQLAKRPYTAFPRTMSTIGIDLQIINGVRVWDTSGQPRFRHVIATVLQHVDVLVVVRPSGVPYEMPKGSFEKIFLATRGEDDIWVDTFKNVYPCDHYRVDDIQSAQMFMHDLMQYAQPRPRSFTCCGCLTLTR